VFQIGFQTSTEFSTFFLTPQLFFPTRENEFGVYFNLENSRPRDPPVGLLPHRTWAHMSGVFFHVPAMPGADASCCSPPYCRPVLFQQRHPILPASDQGIHWRGCQPAVLAAVSFTPVLLRVDHPQRHEALQQRLVGTLMSPFR
jgi:hypothetical protein